MDRRRIIDERIRDLEAERARLNALGNDDLPNGSVIKFKLKFQAGGRWYTFAGVKVRGAWYLSGRTRYPLSWDSLVSQIVGAYAYRGVKVAESWKKLGS